MVFDYKILYDAWRATVTLNSVEPNRVKYRYYLEENLFGLANELNTKTYQPSPFRDKVILYPKKRIAQVPSLRDKIVQHAIYDNGLYDMLTKPLIKGVSACMVNRGDGYASQHLKDLLVHYKNKYGTKFYCLKCDIKSYFATIPHDRLYELIERYVTDDDFKWIMKRFIDQSDVGLALGLPQSQALANLYLSELDHNIKEKLHAEFYGRHMDDFYIISNDYDYLKKCLDYIENYVASVGLKLNPKTCIYENKIEFLGFKYFFGNENGKIVMRLLSQKRRSKRRGLKKKLKSVASGEMSAEQFALSYGGWRAHALRGNCYSLVKTWDEWITAELKKLGYQLIIHKRSVRIKNE